MESGQISTQLDSFVRRCGVYGDTEPPRRVCANILRKSASTLTIQEFLTHSQGPTVKYYRFFRKEAQALKRTEVLKDIFGSQQKSLWPERTALQNLKENFDVEIRQQKISMDVVREKRRGLPCLDNMTDIQVRDKIRSIWRIGS